jgi:polyisoprenoid-binding protein YceI
MKFSLITLSVIVLAFLFVPAPASAGAYTLDPAHTTIGFSVKHLGLMSVTGTFDEYQGTGDWDGKTLTSGSADITIQVKSVNTRNETRDKHLRTGFFDAEKYPTITFKTDKVVKTVKDKAKVMGDLTIRGVTKKVTLDLTYLGTVEKDPWGNTRSAFKATTTINRKDFGVKVDDAADLLVGDDVHISIESEAIKQK